jgi:ABC-2 type transport system permease protein
MSAERLGGLTLAQMLWYLVVSESIMLSGPRVAQVVDEDVRTGALAVQMVRPVSYPLYRLATTVGERAVRFTMNLAVGSLIALLLVGSVPVTPFGLAVFALSVPLAFVVDFLGNFLIGLFAFWLEDTSGLLLIYSRMTMILGGMLIPLELFPAWLRPVLQSLPFAQVVYGPSRMFVAPDWQFLLLLVCRQMAAIAAFGLAVWLVWSLAKRRVFANGG